MCTTETRVNFACAWGDRRARRHCQLNLADSRDWPKAAGFRRALHLTRARGDASSWQIWTYPLSMPTRFAVSLSYRWSSYNYDTWNNFIILLYLLDTTKSLLRMQKTYKHIFNFQIKCERKSVYSCCQISHITNQITEIHYDNA